MDQTPSHHGQKQDEIECSSNETIRLLLNRGSCRNFDEKEIPDDILDQILAAGIHAPTGGNLQPWSIIKITSPSSRNQLTEWCHQGYMAKAPVHLLFCIDWHRLARWADLTAAPYAAHASFRHFWISIQDVICSAQNICTAADSLGLGSVYIGTIMEFFEEVRALCELPDRVMPVVLLCLGYPKSNPGVRRKLGQQVLVHEETYSELSDADLLTAYDQKYPGQKVEVTPERLEAIKEVCTDLHGEPMADRCLAEIERAGFINPCQRYFGLHYEANMMARGNDEFLKQVKDFGFRWFEKFSPDAGRSEQS